jgi:hypothetical protein
MHSSTSSVGLDGQLKSFSNELEPDVSTRSPVIGHVAVTMFVSSVAFGADV